MTTNPTTKPQPTGTLEEAVAAACATFRVDAERFGSLLLDACRAFGLNPDPDARPRELLGLRGEDGDPDEGRPPRVILVSGGGLKLRWPLDDDTERTLRYQVFSSWRLESVPKSREQRLIELPLPADLTLPDVARTGRIPPRPAQRPGDAERVAAFGPGGPKR